METFEKFIAPLSTDLFLNDYWQDTPLFLNREDGLEDIITVEEIDAFFGSLYLSYPSVRVIGNGTELALEEYKHNGMGGFNYLNKEAIFKLFSQGNTIVIQGASFLFKNLGRFVHALEKEMGMQVNSNIYITPSKSKGFHPHFDTHDVFIYQVSGAKNWNIYDMPVKSPIGNWQLSQKQMKHYQNSEPNHKLVLNEGSVLYIPRGVVHEAFTNDEPSIHITFGLHPILKLDIIKQLLTRAKKNSFFREPYFPGFDNTSQKHKEATIKEVYRMLDQVIEDLPLRPDYSEKYFNAEGIFGSMYAIDKQKSVADLSILDIKVNDEVLEKEEIRFLIDKISLMKNDSSSDNLNELKTTLKMLTQKKYIEVVKT